MHLVTVFYPSLRCISTPAKILISEEYYINGEKQSEAYVCIYILLIEININKRKEYSGFIRGYDHLYDKNCSHFRKLAAILKIGCHFESNKYQDCQHHFSCFLRYKEYLKSSGIISAQNSHGGQNHDNCPHTILPRYQNCPFLGSMI